VIPVIYCNPVVPTNFIGFSLRTDIAHKNSLFLACAETVEFILCFAAEHFHPSI
jgi:hypothetical protein